MTKWDIRFMEMCRVVAKWSKDPSTKCGAVIVRADNTIVSQGYNGFPRGIADTDERLHDRQLKYELIVHAEMNAILVTREPVANCTLYVWPLLPCARCAVHIIQAGIAKVVSPVLTAEQAERWGSSLALTRSLFAEAGVEYVEVAVV